MPLFGHDPIFNDLFEKQAEMAKRAAQTLFALSQDFGSASEHAEALKQVEAEADNLTHELANKADAKFVTPFDKEDMHQMSIALDDLTDYIEATGARISLYRIEKPRPDFPPLVEMLQQAVQAVCDGVRGLRHLKNDDIMQQSLIRIHELENSSDQLYRTAIGLLFSAGDSDPLTVIKWKEVYDRIEVTVDKCEDLAVMLESMVIKYG